MQANLDYGRIPRQHTSSSGRGSVNWWVVGAAGVVVLLLVVLIRPAPNPRVQQAVPATVPTLGHPSDGPEHVSVVDVIGKVSLAVLLAYAIGFVLAKARRHGWFAKEALPDTPPTETDLRIRNSLPLGHQEGTLYLVEVEGHSVLLGSAPEQLQVLWTAAPATTTSFAPIIEEPAEQPEAPDELLVPPEMPLFHSGFGQPTRRESDWARERSRLISALMRSE